jgi:hypothetical protein
VRCGKGEIHSDLDRRDDSDRSRMINPLKEQMMPGAVTTTTVEQVKTVPVKGAEAQRSWRAMAAHCLAFALLWAAFWRTFDQFPYIATGADVVYYAKTQIETSGVVFPRNVPGEKVIVFGNSRVLAGFVPEYFDRIASDRGGRYVSFNSGFPARDGFVAELTEMVRRGQTPDVVLLTQPWRESATVFKFFRNDHDLAERAFPFRHLPRDTVSFLANSRVHGGLANSYRLSQKRARQMLLDRGYYFIAEQSHFPAESLPPDFHLPTDTPHETVSRMADPESRELTDLNRILDQHHIRCFYVPDYRRTAAAAPAVAYDQKFADLLRRNSSCRLLGPDYFSYPNELFSDSVHLNHKGALIYTEDIHRLLAQAQRP